MHILPSQAQIIIRAKVFRAKKVKPRFVPQSIWRYALRRRWPGTGTWIDKGVLAKQDISK